MAFSKIKSDDRVENKTTRKLRIALWFVFLLNIVCLSLPFVGEQSATEYYSWTGIDMFMALFVDGDKRFPMIGALSLVFFILPIVGFFAAFIDKHSYIKCLICLLVSVAGVACICFMISTNISIGSVFSMLLYLVSAVFSVLLFLYTATTRNKEKENS